MEHKIARLAFYYGAEVIPLIYEQKLSAKLMNAMLDVIETETAKDYYHQSVLNYYAKRATKKQPLDKLMKPYRKIAFDE